MLAQSQIGRARGHLRTRSCAELVEHALHVVLGSLLANDQALGQLAVGESAGLATSLLAAQQIEQKCVQVGGRQSPLGRAVDPRSEVRADGAGFVKDYSGGRITFTSDGGASAFKTHRTVIRYRGMHCFGRSEGQAEPYAIVGVYGTDSHDKAVVQKFLVGRDSYTNFVASTDASESEEITLDWTPQTLVIVSTVMEHDSGDADHVVAKVEESIKKAAIDAGADPADVDVFTGILDDLDIPGLIANMLGVGDDLIGIESRQINASDIAPKRRMQRFGSISSTSNHPC